MITLTYFEKVPLAKLVTFDVCESCVGMITEAIRKWDLRGVRSLAFEAIT